MSRDAASLQPVIHAILTAPGVDLTTISAKRVRKQLAVQDPSLGEEWIRENKDVLDAIIATVFTEITPPMLEAADDVNGNGVESEAGPSVSSPRRKTRVKAEDKEAAEEDEDDPDVEEEKKRRPAKKAKKSRSEAQMTDAEYAKQLSEELNSRTRSSRSAATKGNGSKRVRGGKAKSRRGPISAATVDSDGEEDDDGEGLAKKRKRSGGGGAKGGFMKEYVLSEPLAAVMQVDKLSRPQVVKRLWEYIKGNDLQNPSNRREIVCDDSLRAVFGQDKIDMFKMNKVLGDHLHETEA